MLTYEQSAGSKIKTYPAVMLARWRRTNRCTLPLSTRHRHWRCQQAFAARAHDCSWHLADIDAEAIDVGYWTLFDIGGVWGERVLIKTN